MKFLTLLLVNYGFCDQEFTDMVMRKFEEQDMKIQELETSNIELKSTNQILETKLEVLKTQFQNGMANIENKMHGQIKKWNETFVKNQQKLSASEESTNAQWVNT